MGKLQNVLSAGIETRWDQRKIPSGSGAVMTPENRRRSDSVRETPRVILIRHRYPHGAGRCGRISHLQDHRDVSSWPHAVGDLYVDLHESAG
jgi:hypothetical protein